MIATASKVGSGQRAGQVSCPDSISGKTGKIFYLQHSVLSYSGATHGYRFLFPVVKGGRSVKRIAHLDLEARLSTREAIAALPHMTSWRGAYLAVMTAEPKQRYNSRFTSIYRVVQKSLDNRRCLNINCQVISAPLCIQYWQSSSIGVGREQRPSHA
jgi:hypothetical protein